MKASIPAVRRSCSPERGSRADATKQDGANLYDYAWFWGDATADEVNAFISGRPDGTFLVPVPQIENRRNRCGFSLGESLRFGSVAELVEFYERHELTDYNRELNVQLKYALARPDFAAAGAKAKHGVDARARVAELMSAQMHYARDTRHYDVLYESMLDLSSQRRSKLNAIQAFSEAHQCYANSATQLENTLKLHDDNHNGGENLMTPGDVNVVKENVALIKSRMASLESHKAALQAESDVLEQEVLKTERKINSIRPKLLWLYQEREKLSYLLTRQDGFTSEMVAKFLAEANEKAKVEFERNKAREMKKLNDNDNESDPGIESDIEKDIGMGFLNDHPSPDSRGDHHNPRFATIEQFVQYYAQQSLQRHNAAITTVLTRPGRTVAN